MKVILKQHVVTEKEVDVSVRSHIYLIIMRHTRKDGSQYVDSFVTFDHKGNPPYRENEETDVVAVYEYRMTERESVPSYEVYGDDYLKRID